MVVAQCYALHTLFTLLTLFTLFILSNCFTLDKPDRLTIVPDCVICVWGWMDGVEGYPLDCYGY